MKRRGLGGGAPLRHRSGGAARRAWDFLCEVLRSGRRGRQELGRAGGRTERLERRDDAHEYAANVVSLQDFLAELE